MNAKHAKDYAHWTKEDTIPLLQKGATGAAAVVRGLSDDQVNRELFAEQAEVILKALREGLRHQGRHQAKNSRRSEREEPPK